MSQVVSANTPGAKKAILHYKVLDQQEINGKSRTLLKIRLETGRHHQIRVQLSHEGLPLLGDRKYNPSGEKVHHWDFVPVVWNSNTPEQENDEV